MGEVGGSIETTETGWEKFNGLHYIHLAAKLQTISKEREL